MRISQRALNVEPFRAMGLIAKADQIDRSGHRVVRLNLGEPDFGASAPVRAAMAEAMDGRPLPYGVPKGDPALRARICEFYRDRHGVEIDPRRVFITSGASSALLLLTAATVDPGSDVILADPSYLPNRELVRAFGGNLIAVPTTAESRFQLTADMVREHWTERTQAVMIASPSNPTGTSLAPEELAAICDATRELGGWRIVDEIYLDGADPRPDGTPPETALVHDPEAIIVSSFSKYFGMTGWRLGWCIVPDALVGVMDSLAVDFFLGPQVPAQYAAIHCFDPEVLAEADARRIDMLERRALMIEGLARIGIPVASEPNGAFYAFTDISATGLDSATFCERALDEAHVALTPGHDFGPTHGDTHIRLSYASSKADIVEGIDRLGRWLDTVRGA